MCPTCNATDSSFVKRISRKFIFKLLPGSKFYKCSKCHSKFLVFFKFKIIIKNTTVIQRG